MKNIFKIIGVTLISALLLAGCAAKSDEITVISREDGSGTRGAFIELFGVEQKDESGSKIDRTVTTADVTNSNSVMMTSVAGNELAIGYISLGSLNDTVKALKINGVYPSVDSIKSGEYKISRPFNIATGANISGPAQDFIAFIMSDKGQSVVNDRGYISVSAGEFATTGASGKIVVAGSSSVSPVMEKLIEAYKAENPNVEIELQQSDSSTGIKYAGDGTCDIGMASRALKDSELSGCLTSTTIAMDGIAVIVNNANTLDNIESSQVQGIYTGEITAWGALK